MEIELVDADTVATDTADTDTVDTDTEGQLHCISHSSGSCVPTGLLPTTC